MEHLRQWTLTLSLAALAGAAIIHVVGESMPAAWAQSTSGVKCNTFNALLPFKRSAEIEAWMSTQMGEGRSHFVNATPGTYADSIICAW